MAIKIIVADVLAGLARIDPNSVDCVVTSPPYWGLRDYGVAGQIGMESSLGEHIDKLVEVFEAVRRVMKPAGTLWLNYGDCYATTPNGRSAAEVKASGLDDRAFRDKPFSTIGHIYRPKPGKPFEMANGATRRGGGNAPAGGRLKAKDLCMIPNRLAIALQDSGWWVRSEIIWGKPNPMPDSAGRYRPAAAHEKIFMLSKTGRPFYDAEAVRMRAAESSIVRWQSDIEAQAGSTRANGGTRQDRPMKAVGGPKRKERQRGHARPHAGFNDRWDSMSAKEQRENGRFLRNYEPDITDLVPPEILHMATAGFSGAHFATFPPALAAVCIKAGCPAGGLVLDPFGGAGTTALAADRLGRDSILIELNPEYALMAADRLKRDQGFFSNITVEGETSHDENCA